VRTANPAQSAVDLNGSIRNFLLKTGDDPEADERHAQPDQTRTLRAAPKPVTTTRRKPQ